MASRKLQANEVAAMLVKLIDKQGGGVVIERPLLDSITGWGDRFTKDIVGMVNQHMPEGFAFGYNKRIGFVAFSTEGVLMVNKKAITELEEDGFTPEQAAKYLASFAAKKAKGDLE